MSNCYERVSLKSFLLSRVGQDSKISHLSNGPRENFCKVQYVLELIKWKKKNPNFGTAMWWGLLQGSVLLLYITRSFN